MKKHDEAFRKVVDSLKKHNMVVDQGKCRLHMEAVEFCGHILSAGHGGRVRGSFSLCKSGNHHQP